MAFEAGFLGWTKSRRIVRIVVNIVVAGGARILQLLYVETVWNRDIVRIDFRGGTLHIKDLLMTADAVRIDLVQFGRKTSMLSIALQRKDIDAWHQGMACCVALRAVDLGMHGRLLPERGFPLLVMTGHTEFLFGRRISGKGNGRIKREYDQDSPQGPRPEREMWNLRNFGDIEIHHVLSSVSILPSPPPPPQCLPAGRQGENER